MTFPFDHSLHFNLGVTYYNHKDYEKAIDCFFKAISINPFHPGKSFKPCPYFGGTRKEDTLLLSFGIYLSH